MKSILDQTDLKGKYVLVRAALNLPLQDGQVQNNYRLKCALPTLRYLSEQGARVLLISHIGRAQEETLQPVFAELTKFVPAHWGGVVTGDEFAKRRALMADGDILMAENLRQDERERANDPEFAAALAALADLYVNDAFAVAHREHASTYGVAKLLPAYAGLTMAQEVRELERVMQPAAPGLFILGGAKFDTKMPLVEKYLEVYDHVFIGGALANDVLKAKGYEVGQSLVSDISLADTPLLQSKKLIVPIDVIVDGPDGCQIKAVEEVTRKEKILDCGPMTVDMLATYVEDANTVLWNGPLGAYEMGYTQSTEVAARYVAAADAFTVVGGGDTIAAIEKLEINDLFGFVSTGGGAMLAFLEHGTTSVIDLLR